MIRPKHSKVDAALAALSAYGRPLLFGELRSRIAFWSLCDLPLELRDVQGLDAGGFVGCRFDEWSVEMASVSITDIGRAASRPGILPPPQSIVYTNWKGVRQERHILPVSTFHGSNKWHPEPQWLLLALDVEKRDDRTFAMRDME